MCDPVGDQLVTVLNQAQAAAVEQGMTDNTSALEGCQTPSAWVEPRGRNKT